MDMYVSPHVRLGSSIKQALADDVRRGSSAARTWASIERDNRRALQAQQGAAGHLATVAENGAAAAAGAGTTDSAQAAAAQSHGASSSSSSAVVADEPGREHDPLY